MKTWARSIRRSRAIPSVLLIALASCSKPSADDHLARAESYVEQHQPSEASIEYRSALQVDPNRGDIRLKLADLYVQQGELAGALREYVRAADLLPDDAGTQLKAGQLLLRAGQFQDARARAERALRIDPKLTEAQVLLGNTLAGLRDFDGAIAEYQQALAINPNEDVAYRNIATVELARGQQAEAEAAFRKAIEVAPASVPAHLALAGFFWASNRTADAERLFKETLALDGGNLEANRALGLFYMGSGRTAEAEPYFKAVAASLDTPDAKIGLADYYLITKRYDDARALLHEAAADEAAYPKAELRQAAIDVALGMAPAAKDRLRHLLERHPKDAPAHLMNARLLAAENDRESALAEATTILTDDPNSPQGADAQLLIGTLQASLDRPEAAIKAFEDVIRRRPETVAAMLALAQLHLRMGSLDRAERYVTDALGVDVRNPAARAESIRIRLAKGELARARQELATLRAEFPNASAVLKLVAAQQLAERQPGAARATYLKVLEALPNDIDALAGVVRIDLASGRGAEALRRVEAKLEGLAPTGELYVLGAETALALANRAKGEEYLKKAIEVEPTLLRAYSMLGVLYVSQDRLAEAEANFRQTVERNPSSVSAGTMLGMLYDAQGRPAEAEKEYSRVLSLDRTAAVAANNLAWIYVSSNRVSSETLELARTAQGRLPDEPNVNDTLGWIYTKQGQFRDAIRHLEMSIEKMPNAADTHYHLALAYLGFGERDKARESLTRALTLNPTFADAADAKRKLAELRD